VGELVAHVHTAHLVEGDHVAASDGNGRIQGNHVGVVLLNSALTNLTLMDNGQLTNLLHGGEQNVGVLAVLGKWVSFLDLLANLHESAGPSAADINCFEDLSLELILEFSFD